MTDHPPEKPPADNHKAPHGSLEAGFHPLRPDLYQFVRLERGPADMRMMMLNHPFLSIEIEDFNDCRTIHDAIDEATDLLEEVVEQQNWREVIYRHDERHRLRAFCEYAHLLSDQDYWSILGDLYREYQAERTLADAFPGVLIFHQLLQSQRPGRDLLMDETDRQLFNRLPMSFTVYRGYARGDGAGISWTPDRKVAVFFAHREWEFSDGRHVPKVLKAIVTDKSHAYAFFRKETEVLIPMHRLSVLATDVVTEETSEHPLDSSFNFEGWLAEAALH